MQSPSLGVDSMKVKKFCPVLIFIIVLILFLTVTNFPASPHLANPRLVMKDRFLWDKTAMAMMRNVSTIVPRNATIAVSDYKPDFELATHLRAIQPWDLSSAKRVHDFVSKQTPYLVVLEHDWDPNLIWGAKGLQNLSNYYHEIGSFNSEFFKVHVLREKG